MIKPGIIGLFNLLCAILACAQKARTIIPNQPVIIGTAFQVQYIITNPSDFSKANTPGFDNFQIVSGPNYYKGNALIDGINQPIENITYTLVPSKSGTIKIPGIEAEFRNGSKFKSEDSNINVIQPPDASYNTRSSYTDAELYGVHSSKDLQEIITKNLFIKASVNKKSVVIGEPVIVTFTLYSRLQSSSEVIKAPGFYGFSMVDMIDVNKAHPSIENVKGKIFNTSVLRKVQLYPVQSGKLEIDPMYVHNVIEFEDPLNKSKKTTVEKDLQSESLSVTVKELPYKKPENYTGAVGSFSISANLENDTVALNQQNRLLIHIKGQGNFIQFSLPFIPFESNYHVSEPVIIDKINKEVSPEEGSKSYEFNLLTDSTGSYKIPSIAFPYFDLTSRSFKIIKTDSLTFFVTKEIKINSRASANFYSPKLGLWWISILIGIIAVIVLFFLFSRRKKPVPIPNSDVNPYLQQLNTIDTNRLSVKESCLEIQKTLSDILREKNRILSDNQKQEIKELTIMCQLSIYSGTNMIDINDLKAKAIMIATSLI